MSRGPGKIQRYILDALAETAEGECLFTLQVLMEYTGGAEPSEALWRSFRRAATKLAASGAIEVCYGPYPAYRHIKAKPFRPSRQRYGEEGRWAVLVDEDELMKIGDALDMGNWVPVTSAMVGSLEQDAYVTEAPVRSQMIRRPVSAEYRERIERESAEIFNRLREAFGR